MELNAFKQEVEATKGKFLDTIGTKITCYESDGLYVCMLDGSFKHSISRVATIALTASIQPENDEPAVLYGKVGSGGSRTHLLFRAVQKGQPDLTIQFNKPGETPDVLINGAPSQKIPYNNTMPAVTERRPIQINPTHSGTRRTTTLFLHQLNSEEYIQNGLIHERLEHTQYGSI